jgi:hypothetical protein
MVFGDVHPRLTEERADAPNHTWYVIVGENEKSIPRLHVDVECANPRKAGSGSWLRGSRNCNFLHPTAQSYLDRVRVILDCRLGAGKVYSACLSDSSRVDQIQPFLLYRPLQQTSRCRRQQGGFRSSQGGAGSDIDALYDTHSLGRQDGAANCGRSSSQCERWLDFTPLATDIRDVDRPRQLPTQQSVADRHAHVHRYVPLSLGCRGADVRGQ